MPAAKYQPAQDDWIPTSSRALYARAESGPANFKVDPERPFPFILANRRTEADDEADLGAAAAPPNTILANKRTEAYDEAQNPVSAVEGGKVPDQIPLVVPRPRFPDPDYRFQLLQQWECVVRSVSTREFVAVLYDLTDRCRAEEEAIFPLEEVPDSDRPFVEPGSVFYWSIGYRTSSTGQKDRISQIRFRRLPTWTASERRDAVKEAAEFEELLGGR
jgi:hypothetical protein